MKRPLIFIDLDETLWASRMQNGWNMLQQAEWELAHTTQKMEVSNDRIAALLARRIPSIQREIEQAREAETIQFGDVTYDFVVNPYAEAVLAELAKYGELCVFTAAKRDYAEGALHAFGLARYFKRLYSTRDALNDWSVLEKGRRFVLLDDAQGASRKLAWALKIIATPNDDLPEGVGDQLRANHIAKVDPPFTWGSDGIGLPKAAQRAILLLRTPAR
jgi:hypothetical protein